MMQWTDLLAMGAGEEGGGTSEIAVIFKGAVQYWLKGSLEVKQFYELAEK